MKTGTELILATKQFARDQSWTSWWHVLSTTFLLTVAMTGAFLNYLPLPARLVCSLFGGLLLLRLFVIYHDQQHHAILPKSRVAEFLMRIFGVLALSPSSVWRSSHNHHHTHNSKLRGSHIGSFPIMTKAQYLKSPLGKRIKYLFMRHPLTIALGYIFVFLYGMCIYPFWNEPKKHFDCLISVVLHVIIGVALIHYFGWLTWLLVQTLPYMMSCAIGSYLFYAQHNFPSVSFNDSAGWTYEKAAMESSSFLRTNPVMAWFTANIGYHHIHHLNARIPFYRLPEVFRALPELQTPKTTSLMPLEVIRCLRLKVWDVEAQRMVGLGRHA
jgi:omega-6 fatty acid desaturase (delta-12 desaturase)